MSSKIFILTLLGALISPAMAEAQQPASQLGFGVGAQYVYVPSKVMSIFVETPRPVSGKAFMAFMRYSKNTSVMMLRVGHMAISADDGVWLGRGHDWNEAKYERFDSPGFMWMDFYFGSELPMGPTGLSFFYGGAIGMGLVEGDIYSKDAYGCTENNYDPPSGTCVFAPLEEKEDVPRYLPTISLTAGIRYQIIKWLSVQAQAGVFIPGFVTAGVSVMGHF